MAEQRRRRVNHKGSILNIRTFHPNNLLPGMIITFVYNSPTAYDRNPLLFYFGEGTKQKEGTGKSRKNAPREIIKKTISGINFNYLMPDKVQKLFEWTLQSFEGRYNETFKDENFFNLGGEFTRMGFTTGIAPSDVDVGEYMNRYVNQRLLNFEATSNCFRTYKLEYVSGMKIVDFDIKIYEKYQKQKGGFLREYIESGGTFIKGETPDFSKSQNKILYKTLRKKYGI